MIISFVNKYCNEQVKTYDNYKYQVLLIEFLFHEKIIYLKKMYNGRYILTFNISINKNISDRKIRFFKYNCE